MSLSAYFKHDFNYSAASSITKRVRVWGVRFQQRIPDGPGGSGIVLVSESCQVDKGKKASGVWQMNTVYCQVKNDDWVWNTVNLDYLVVDGLIVNFRVAVESERL